MHGSYFSFMPHSPRAQENHSDFLGSKEDHIRVRRNGQRKNNIAHVGFSVAQRARIGKGEGERGRSGRDDERERVLCEEG